jgi:NitT/TauT family transport system ATP-binding protein
MSAEPVELRIGFLPLLDSAVLVAAHEKGFAGAQGLALRLHRETSWANIRDRVAVGHFEAAHMLGPMVVAESIGAGQLNVPLAAPVALGHGGNAITVSLELWREMRHEGAHLGGEPVAQAAALGRVIRKREQARHAPPTFAMVFPYSCHNYQLRDWLSAGGIDPDMQARLIVLPPPLLVDALRTGQVDGFCVGEPWNSLAVESGLGVIAALSSEIWQDPPEKVLGMRTEYAHRHPEHVAALVRCVVSASEWAAQPGNREELAQLLAEPRYVGAPVGVLRGALEGTLRLARGHAHVERDGFFRLGVDATVPELAHARRFYECMLRWRQISGSGELESRALASFRPDLRQNALGALTKRGHEA